MPVGGGRLPLRPGMPLCGGAGSSGGPERANWIRTMAITVVTSTRYVGQSELRADGTRTVQTSGVHGEVEFTAGFVLIALGLSHTAVGEPVMPKLGSGPNMPECRHSSECAPEVWERAKKAKKLVIVGAGKAGCDILNFGCDPSWPNVLWCHRGHHVFWNRRWRRALACSALFQLYLR